MLSWFSSWSLLYVSSVESSGRAAIRETESTCAIPVKDNRVVSGCSLLRTGGQTQQVPRQRSPLEPVPRAFAISRWCPLLGCFCLSILQLQSKTSPLRVWLKTFDLLPAIRTHGRYLGRFARCRHGFALQTVASFQRPRLTHYYGIICHLTSHGWPLELPLAAALLARFASPMGELTRSR